jgi:tetratricopeptide (TPR) repeat protein
MSNVKCRIADAVRSAVSGGRWAFVLLLPALLLAQVPKPEELVKQGVALEKDGKWLEARALYQQALDKKPNLAEANYRVGMICLNHYPDPDSIKLAVTRFETARDNRYDLNKVEPALADAYYRSGVFSTAIETYLKAIERKPKQADLRIHLAEVYFANGNDDEAHTQDSIAMVLEVANLTAKMLHGRIHARRHEFDVAKEEYRKVIAADPSRVEAFAALAELFKVTQPDSAIAYYGMYLRLQPEDANVNFALSGIYYQLSQKALANLPAPADTQDTLAMKQYVRARDSANAFRRAANSESAFVYVGNAIKYGFNREDIYDFFVSVAQAAHNRSAAITALNAFIAKNPNDAIKIALLGQVLADSAVVKNTVMDTAVLRRSIEAYKQACTIDSSFRRRVFPWIAKQYYNQKQYDSSITYYTRVIQIDPKAASAYINRGYGYIYGKNDKARGIADLQAAIAIDPRRVDMRVFVMKLYYGDKEYNDAYDAAKAVLDIAPDNEDAKAVKKNIEIMRAPKPKPGDEE